MSQAVLDVYFGHEEERTMSKTAILYARVSSRRQAETFSLPSQFRELRAWAEENGYTVIEEVADEGGRDSKRDVLERPGINRIFDLCEGRRVNVVLAQERSRFGEHPVPDMIAYRLAQSGTVLRTPGDSGEDEAGELMQMFTDWMSRRERRTTAKRSRSRKLEQARNGYVVPTHTPAYGFRVAGEKAERVYEVEEEHMRVVRLIFEMVGREEMGMLTVAKKLNREGIPSPPAPVKRKEENRGKLYIWRPQFVRSCVLNDAYKPHTPEEVEALVEQGFMAPEVAARAPDPCGIWWYVGRDFEGTEHRVAVPVPDSGVPREVADAARKAIENNVPASAAGGGRFWQLLGGITRCGWCGLRMQAHAVKNPVGRVYHYMRCPFHKRTTGPDGCPLNVRVPVEKAEEAVWRFVYRKLLSPGEITRSLDALIAAERRRLGGDPEAEVRELRRRLERLTLSRAAYQDQQAAGHMTLDELGARLQQIEEAREEILRQIDATENRGSRVVELQQIRDSYARGGSMYFTYVEGGRPPYDADPKERHDEYRRLELRVMVLGKDELEVSGVFETQRIYTDDPSPRPRRPATTSS